MKKFICFSLIIVFILSCLTACNFTSKLSGILAGEAESTAEVEKMLTFLTENRISDAKDLMHPDASAESDAPFVQIATYLSGRKVKNIDVETINVNNSTGTSGKVSEENVVYLITLDDDEVFYINSVYLSNNNGSGFTSFQLILGLV